MPRERIRAHPPSTVIESVRGIPPLFAHLINTPPETDSDNDKDDELDADWKFLKQISHQWDDDQNVSAFNLFCREILKIEEYQVSFGAGAGMPNENDPQSRADDPNDPGHGHHTAKNHSGSQFDFEIDIGVQDKYVQGILLHREIIAQELFAIKKDWELMADQLARLKSSIPRLARHTFYGNKNAYKVAESSVPMLTWILNKSKLPKELHMLTIKSISEMLHTSKLLKKKFAECKGAKLLLHCMREMPNNPEIACWAGYCLTMACINSPEMIHEAKKDSKLLDLVTEIAFDIYWFNWPINYGLLLQGIFFGQAPPHQRENFQFI